MSYVVYILNSFYHIGYSVNKQHYFKIKMKNQDIGAYSITFNKKSSFIFKTNSVCEGFFIRKKNWLALINNEDSKDIVSLIKHKFKAQYELVIERYLTNLKEQDLKRVKTINGPSGVIQLCTDNHFYEN